MPGGDANVVFHEIKNELINLVEKMEITIDNKTLETGWFRFETEADDDAKIIMNVARHYCCNYILTRRTFDPQTIIPDKDKPRSHVILLSPPPFREKISITIQSVWLPT
jgi:hypothetical protein